jgi:putative transposase
MIKTYRFRIYPKKHQIESMNTMLNLSCELYNAMLQQRIYAYRSKKKVNYRSQQDEIPELKKMFPEYGNIHSLVIQDVVHRVDRAFDNFFRRISERKKGKNIKAGFPRFKSIDRYNSMTYTQSGFRIMDNGHVWLSKIGEIRMFMHRSFTGDIKTVSVKHDSVGDWFITITVDNHKPDGKAAETESATIQNILSEPISPVGIDMGLKSIITTSDDTHVEPPQYLRKSEKKLKKAQKQLSRKKKGSGKRSKAKNRVQKVHRKIQRQRDDFAHKVSTQLISSHDLIVFEDLNIKGMIRNHNLSKSISDAGWNKIIQYTMYKAESAGTMVILVDPRQTSQECSGCGNTYIRSMGGCDLYIFKKAIFQPAVEVLPSPPFVLGNLTL